MNETKPNVSTLQRIFPFLLWFEDYQVTYLRSDVLAGLTVFGFAFF